MKEAQISECIAVIKYSLNKMFEAISVVDKTLLLFANLLDFEWWEY